jgi:hypothetical protein
MTEEQYRQMLRNRAARGGGRLFDDRAARHVLREAARGLRRREAAYAALTDAVPDAWLRTIELEAPDRATVVLRVRDAVVCEQLRRRSVQLRRQLTGRLAGLRRLVVARQV